MAACTQCLAENRPGARFCAGCGAPLGAASALLPAAPQAVRLCPRCACPNRAAARFCAGCGRVFCPTCGHANRPAARFCQRCGRPLARPAPVATPTLGLIGGRYRILREAGDGGMGIVYLAEDTQAPGSLRRALKRLRTENVKPGDLPELVEGFRREAALLMTLAHPNLVRAYDCFSEGGREYLAMDYIDGHTLAHMVRVRPLDEAQVLDFGVQLCDVLGYLHGQSRPIIYRDMKPSNVMLETATGLVKMLDFGAARFFKPGKLRDTVSIGTEGFAPPEQYGKGQTDARSDVYALGATLYVLLTNYDVAQNPMHFPPIRERNPAVSAELASVIHRAVEPRMDDRFQSTAEMRAALAACPGYPR